MADSVETQPEAIAEQNEELQIAAAVLPHLKDRDAERLQAMLDCNGDRDLAARQLGVDLETFNRRWRQTTLKNIQRAIAANFTQHERD